MNWVRFDDGWLHDPMVMQMGLEPRALYQSALFYCGKGLTDGYVDAAAIPKIALMADVVNVGPSVDRLLGLGALDSLEDGYYYIRRWREHVREREVVLHERAERAAAGRVGGQQSQANRRAKSLPNGKAKSLANGKAKPKALASGASEPLPVPTRPVPSLPVPSLPDAGGANGAPPRTPQPVIARSSQLLTSPPARTREDSSNSRDFSQNGTTSSPQPTHRGRPAKIPQHVKDAVVQGRLETPPRPYKLLAQDFGLSEKAIGRILTDAHNKALAPAASRQNDDVNDDNLPF